FRSSKEADGVSPLPAKTTPSAEINSPVSVAAARLFPLFLKRRASSRSGKIATLWRNRAKSGASESGAFTLSIAQATAFFGSAADPVSGEGGQNFGTASAAWPSFFFVSVAVIS